MAIRQASRQAERKTYPPTHAHMIGSPAQTKCVWVVALAMIRALKLMHVLKGVQLGGVEVCHSGCFPGQASTSPGTLRPISRIIRT